MRIIAAFIGALLLATALPSHALNIVTVDEAFFEDAKALLDIQRQMDEKREAFQTEIRAKEAEISEKEAELLKERDLISKEAFEEKTKSFRSQIIEAQQLIQLRNAQLEKANIHASKKIRKEIEAIIAELAEEQEFDLAVSRSRLLYANQKLDISAEVVKRLDERLPTIDLDVALSQAEAASK